MPAGLDVTAPLPLPVSVTINGCVTGLKVAVTARAALIITTQEPVPVHAPLHPAKVEPALGAAVRLTTVPKSKPAPQVGPQLIPAGTDVTVPEPAPERVTVSGRVWIENAAVTLFAPSIVTAQGPVPAQPTPIQPT